MRPSITHPREIECAAINCETARRDECNDCAFLSGVNARCNLKTKSAERNDALRSTRARAALFMYALAGDVKFDLCFVALSMHNAAISSRAGRRSINRVGGR